MTRGCIAALDLGTTAFKCALVRNGALVSEPVVISYSLDYDGINVTVDPGIYLGAARLAIQKVCRQAEEAGLEVEAIGIASQAQTYVVLDKGDCPLQPAVVWLDGRAEAEARKVAVALPDFIRHSGMAAPAGTLFLPKVMHFMRHTNAPRKRELRFLLLNEYIIHYLTGAAYGDNVNQGMGGFYDIRRRDWSQTAMSLAGIDEDNLAATAPATAIGYPLKKECRELFGVGEIPVYSCGNDQSCSAVGSGIEHEKDLACNFGTAMVVYAMKDVQPQALNSRQMAGINPLTDEYFLLGLEPECGNILDWGVRTLYGGDFQAMMDEAAPAVAASGLPEIAVKGNGRLDIKGLTAGSSRGEIMAALLKIYVDAFGRLLQEICGDVKPERFFASGGLSHSRRWLELLQQRYGMEFIRPDAGHTSLIGIAGVIEKKATGA